MAADRVTTRYQARFDALFARGRHAVLTGTHHRERAPDDGGRWGISVILRPEPPAARRLAAVTAEALEVAGIGHWPTGSAGSLHVTVLPLEPYRSVVPDGDPAVVGYAAALQAVAARCRLVGLRFCGLTLSPGGVLACAHPEGRAAGELAAALATATGGYRFGERDLWHATLVHFAGKVSAPDRLVAWVAARRTLDLGTTRAGRADLVRWHIDGAPPRPVVLASQPLASGRGDLRRPRA